MEPIHVFLQIGYKVIPLGAGNRFQGTLPSHFQNQEHLMSRQPIALGMFDLLVFTITTQFFRKFLHDMPKTLMVSCVREHNCNGILHRLTLISHNAFRGFISHASQPTSK